MESFFQAAGAVLVAVILILSFRSQGKDIGLLLSVFICCALGCVAISFLRPVFSFINQLQTMTALDSGFLSVLLKTVGIGLLSEIVCLVCSDAGNSAMGKALQYVAVALILYLSLPMFEGLLEMVEAILEKI